MYRVRELDMKRWLLILLLAAAAPAVRARAQDANGDPRAQIQLLQRELGEARAKIRALEERVARLEAGGRAAPGEASSPNAGARDAAIAKRHAMEAAQEHAPHRDPYWNRGVSLRDEGDKSLAKDKYEEAGHLYDEARVFFENARVGDPSPAAKKANEASAVGALRTIATGEAILRARPQASGYSTLGGLRAWDLVDDALASGTKQGYRFAIVAPDKSTWSATAVPLEPGETGDRTFFIDESGVVRSEGAPAEAGPKSAPVGE
jgi:hypothetical protein